MDDALNTITRVPRRPPPVDVALTVGLMAWAVAEALVAAGPGGLPGRLAFAIAVTLPLLVRRKAPLIVLAALVVTLLVRVWAVPGAEESTFPFPSLLVAVVSVALYERQVVAAVLGGLTALGAMLSLYPLGYYADTPSLGQVVILTFFISGAWAAGYLVRVRAAQAAAAQRATVEAVATERERIARELHDVVAHSLSIIAVQTGAAEELIALDPALAREHVAAARRTAREALTEMRHVLDVQREPSQHADLAPQPTLERVRDVVDEVRAAGLPVTLRVDGARGSVPAGLDLAGYRIVQEALTNVLRHAGAAETCVHVLYEPRGIELEIVNEAGPLTSRDTSGSGRGLVGMRERVRLYGGTVTAAPDRGGFRVHARLPRENS
ncbi:sensor histidine kinase [Paractinoplanes brasiliensis]|uniref:histidine kinase n=1 Tax=Paractinoplanes brasiliensis TaxID=52695 RepID=A0A4R6J8A6_9ACTN|nr:histidine kinase [Actinoplanes brasiliensis]TDO31823.1 signal transduction histidine kinase [Actinoplanes brasiliensis]GID30579.1 two-component sensor histidine kinase [Actinoplanes brasiliensis]